MNEELDKATVHLVEQDCELKRNLDVIYEAKIEESEKAGSHSCSGCQVCN